MAELILTAGIQALEAIPRFEHLQIVEIDRKRYDALSIAFNKFLGRDMADIETNVLYESTKIRLKRMSQDFFILQKMGCFTTDKYNFDSVKSSFENIERDPRYMVAIKCRRLAELASKDLLMLRCKSKEKNLNLKETIDKVCDLYKVAKWIRDYWHIMREIGNEGVHIQEQIKWKNKKDYKHPNADDINILLLASAEVLSTWRTLRENTK